MKSTVYSLGHRCCFCHYLLFLEWLHLTNSNGRDFRNDSEAKTISTPILNPRKAFRWLQKCEWVRFLPVLTPSWDIVEHHISGHGHSKALQLFSVPDTRDNDCQIFITFLGFLPIWRQWAESGCTLLYLEELSVLGVTIMSHFYESPEFTHWHLSSSLSVLWQWT